MHGHEGKINDALFSRYNTVMTSNFFGSKSHRRILDESGLIICLQSRGCVVNEAGDIERFAVDDEQWFHVGCQRLQKPLDGVWHMMMSTSPTILRPEFTAAPIELVGTWECTRQNLRLSSLDKSKSWLV